jgi:uncharacterized protein (TIGR00661 family)
MIKKIIVAPLNWGLGHASRCMPIIQFLLENNFTPIIASDGKALLFLQKEFPTLDFLELPSYHISYAKNLKFGLLFQVPKILKAVKKEHQFINEFIFKNKDVVGVISDNRFGVRSASVHSVYITHQINVFSGFTTFISSKIHQRIIKKFDECWIPDSQNHQLSGKLSEDTNKTLHLKFIGALSRFSKQNLPIKNNVLIVLSGIESQRKSLEEKLLNEFKHYKGKVVLVQGKIEAEQNVREENGISIYNYLLSSELEKKISQSNLIVCRSGYSSIMDVAVLEKKAFLIPTPNQPEQEYLARHLEQLNASPFSTEKEFTLEKLKVIEDYKGLSAEKGTLDRNLLRLFQRK